MLRILSRQLDALGATNAVVRPPAPDMPSREGGFVVRTEQSNALRTTARRRFEDDMVQHLETFAPALSKSLGVTGVQAVVRLAIDRSVRHGFATRGPAQLILQMAVMLGSDFDTDPQLGWAQAILARHDLSERERAKALHAALVRYIGAVAGPQRSYLRAAAERTRLLDVGSLPDLSPGFELQMTRLLDSIYPQKCRYLGPERLKLVIEHGIRAARFVGAPTREGVAVLTALTFALGYGFPRDPQYPWIAETLRNAQLGDPQQRVLRLFARARTYIEYAVARA